MRGIIQKVALLSIALIIPGISAAADTVGIRKENIVLWKSPDDIESRNLLYGPGGKKHAPRSREFVFEKEDKNGTTPKFVVTDVDGVQWKMKLGAEAQPEVAASRLVWAAGYYAHEEYFLPELRIAKVPEHLHRGKDWVTPDATVRNARLRHATEGEKKIGKWKWDHSPFIGTREFNGLRVLMALLNNWDLKDINNAIYEDGSGQTIYAVSDLGGTFGTTGITFSKSEWKGNLDAYRRSEFIRSMTPDFVTFSVPAFPQLSGVLAPRNFVARIKMQWIGKRIPREDARWMGELLGRLSGVQLRDAFRAAGFTAEEVEGFAQVLEDRIAQLKAL